MGKELRVLGVCSVWPQCGKAPDYPNKKKLHLTLSLALSTKFSLKYLKITYIQAWKVTFLWISQITAHNVFLSYILLPAITVIIDCLFLIKSFQHTNLLQCTAAYWVQNLILVLSQFQFNTRTLVRNEKYSNVVNSWMFSAFQTLFLERGQYEQWLENRG